MLLSRSKNSKLQNYDFDKKKCLKSKEGKDIGYYNGSYSEIEVAKESEWTTEKNKRKRIINVTVYGGTLEVQIQRLGYRERGNTIPD